MANGNPRCEFCQGRGGKMIHGRWVKCNCVRMTRSVQELLRKVNSGPDGYIPMSERIRRLDSNGRA